MPKKNADNLEKRIVKAREDIKKCKEQFYGEGFQAFADEEENTDNNTSKKDDIKLYRVFGGGLAFNINGKGVETGNKEVDKMIVRCDEKEEKYIALCHDYLESRIVFKSLTNSEQNGEPAGLEILKYGKRDDRWYIKVSGCYQMMENIMHLLDTTHLIRIAEICFVGRFENASIVQKPLTLDAYDFEAEIIEIKDKDLKYDKEMAELLGYSFDD